MIQPQPTYNGKFMFQKIFTELDYLASGILQIPAGTEKPSKPAKDNSYVRRSLRMWGTRLTNFASFRCFTVLRERCRWWYIVLVSRLDRETQLFQRRDLPLNFFFSCSGATFFVPRGSSFPHPPL